MSENLMMTPLQVYRHSSDVWSGEASGGLPCSAERVSGEQLCVNDRALLVYA